ncbi:protein kinase [Rubripirellula amarantea]|nr:protein kinase [Rubripirellula amarantea]
MDSGSSRGFESEIDAMQEMGSELLDRFDVGESCGSGRYANVFLAHDKMLQRDVAMKVSSLANRSESERQCIRRELKVSCKLRHPNIVSAYDGFESKGTVVLVLPFLSGGNMESSQSNAREGIGRIATLANAVSYLHGLGIIHGDIKPANVLLDPKGGPHLADFGSCQPVKRRNNSRSVELVGSPAYLAPEIAAGTAHPTIASDVYALGATLFFAVAGQAPFQGETIAILTAVQNQTFPTFASVNTHVDSSLQAIVNKACDREPSRRYESAAELAEDLEHYLSNRPIKARTPSLITRAVLWSKRNRSTAALAIVLAAVVCIGTLASATGWAASLSKQASFLRSQAQLEQQAHTARNQETKLSELLSRISAEREEIEQATTAEATLRRQAQATKNQTQAKLDVASAKLVDAERLASVSESLKTSRAEREMVVERLESATDKRARFRNLVTKRQSVLKKLANSSWDKLTFPPSEADVAQSMRGILTEPGRSSKLIELKPFTNPQFVAFNREGNQAILFNRSAKIAKWFRYDQVNHDVQHALIDVASSDENNSDSWLPKVACFSNDSKHFAVSCQVEVDKSVLCICSIETGRLSSKVFFDGLPHAIHCVDQNSYDVIRTRNDDIEIVRLPADVIIATCRSARQSTIGNEAEDEAVGKQLLPFFIDAGTDPAKHMLFASSEIPRGTSKTRVFLHSVVFNDEAEPSSSQRMKTFDCGRQSLADWPHQWQLSQFANLGVGKRSLATQSPPPLSNARHASAGLNDLSRYRATVQVCDQSWQPIAAAVQPTDQNMSVESSLVFSDSLLSYENPHRADHVRQKKFFYRMPSLDRSPGLLIFWVQNKIEVVDLFQGKLVDRNDEVAKQSNNGLVQSGVWAKPDFSVSSSQQNHQIHFRRSKWHWLNVSAWDESLYANIDTVETRLEELSGRMRDPLGLSSLVKHEMQNLNRPQSGYAIKFATEKDRVTSPKVAGINPTMPITIEALVKIDPQQPRSYGAIASFNEHALILHPNRKVSFRRQFAVGGKKVDKSCDGDVALDGRWTHLAGVSNGVDRLTLYVNGKKVRTFNSPFPKDEEERFDALWLNHWRKQTFLGLVDSVRVSNTVRYDKDFTVQLPMDTDEHTMLLYHFDEGEGSRVVDSSGNGYDATLQNAEWIPMSEPANFTVSTEN